MKLYFQDTGSIKSLLREALLCTILRKQDVSPYSLILCSESMKPLVEIAALDLYTSSNEFLNMDQEKAVEANRVVIKYFNSHESLLLKSKNQTQQQTVAGTGPIGIAPTGSATASVPSLITLPTSPQGALLDMDASASKFCFLGIIGIEIEDYYLQSNNDTTKVSLKRPRDETSSTINAEKTISTIQKPLLAVNLHSLSSLLSLIEHEPTLHLSQNLHLCFPLILKKQADLMPCLVALLDINQV